MSAPGSQRQRRIETSELHTLIRTRVKFHKILFIHRDKKITIFNIFCKNTINTVKPSGGGPFFFRRELFR